MRDKAWRDSQSLNPNDNITQVIKNGSLDIGFIGLAEALVVITGAHHGESEEARILGLEIIKFMNKIINEAKNRYGLNYQLVASSKVDLLENFVLMDQKNMELFVVLLINHFTQIHFMFRQIIQLMLKLKLILKHHITP